VNLSRTAGTCTGNYTVRDSITICTMWPYSAWTPHYAVRDSTTICTMWPYSAWTPQGALLARWMEDWPRYRICRVGQNRIYTPYMTVHLVIFLPKLPYIHRIYMVQANPTYLLYTA
jgi:hypothetical protein